jgi:hypothetical protein
MKSISSVLIALALVASIAAPSNAFDAKSFFEQQGREAGG